MLSWTKAPGGKRYNATTIHGAFRVVRQNTAAGAPRWRATVERGATTYHVASGDYLRDVLAACDERFIAYREAMFS